MDILNYSNFLVVGTWGSVSRRTSCTQFSRCVAPFRI